MHVCVGLHIVAWTIYQGPYPYTGLSLAAVNFLWLLT